ncbi:hypothetical protein E4U43_002871 [Claviceps pusilla]|uniref:Uncharacterized protein n=1 Tax=Claviceps pusilla TaxID=123648 RepID=A0A9P7SVT5_9HYPO|nr:hypothetical protein E4U43_002871 [Claviceps pusilla]
MPIDPPDARSPTPVVLLLLLHRQIPDAMQKLSAVHLSSSDTNRVLHLPRRGHKATTSSDGDGLSNRGDAKGANRANGVNGLASRPRSWLPSMKHQRPESPATTPRDGAAPSPAPSPAPLPGPRALTPFRRPEGRFKSHSASPLTDRSTRDREWVDSVRILIKETEEAFQAVRDVLEFNVKDDAVRKASKMRKTGKSRPAAVLVAPPASSVSEASREGTCLAVLDKPLPADPEHKGEEAKREEDKKENEGGRKKEKEKEKEKDKKKEKDKDKEQNKEETKKAQEQKRHPPARPKAKKTRKEFPNKASSSMFRSLSKIKTPTRWIDHILTSARLKRIEADEMITREQIRQFCEGRRLRAQLLECAEAQGTDDGQGRQSSSSDSAGSEFSRTSRGSSSTALSSDHTSLCSATVVVVMDPMDHAVVQRDFSVPQQGMGMGLGMGAGGDGVLWLEQQQQQQQKQKTSAEYPDPPPRNPERSNKRSHRLPTIPEAESDAADGRAEDEHVARSSRRDNRPGGPFSKTRVEKSPPATAAQENDTTASVRKPASTKEGSRAASPQAWDGYDDKTEAEAALYDPDDDGMAEDMADWFQTFGFESHGQLIHVDDQEHDVAGSAAQSAASTVPSDSARVRDHVQRDANASSTDHSLTARPDAPIGAPIRFLTTQGPPRVWTPRAQTPVFYNVRDSAKWHKLAAARTTRV